MIQPHELRINNYYFGDIEITGSLAAKVGLSDSNKVLQLTEEHFKTLVLAGYLNFLSPIPITPEWLERFGFEKKEMPTIGGYKYCKNNIAIADMEPLLFYHPSNTEIKHVHQLQNLYSALTGEELKIKG